MANKKISDLAAASSVSGVEEFEILQGGVNKKLSIGFNDEFRGTWAGTTTFPTVGGRYTSGAPKAGDRWVLTAELSVGGNIYSAGTVVEAIVNGAGATTLTDWVKYSTQL